MKAALDREPVGIALLTYPDIRYTYANAAMRRVLGTDPVGRLQDETCSDYPWPPRSKLKNVAEKGSRLTSRDSRWVMPRVPGAEPEELFFTFEVSRVTVGETVFLLATAVETTDEVEARKRMDTVIDKMQQVLDSVHESIFSLDEHWRLTFANRQAAEQLGRGRESLLHQSFTDLFGEYEAGRLERALKPAMELGREVDFRMPLKSGTTYRIRAFPASTGISVYMSPVEDAAEQHPGSDESLMTLMEMLDSPVALLDTSGRFSAVNEAACAVFGRSREELVGHTPEETFGDTHGGPWLQRLTESLGERAAFRVAARHGDGAELYEHRGIPVATGTVMVLVRIGSGEES